MKKINEKTVIYVKNIFNSAGKVYFEAVRKD